MFGNDRVKMRRFFTEAWRKSTTGETLIPLESMVAEVIKLHPEYHKILEGPDNILDKDYSPEGGESNPFLHMGMHISIHEQLMTDRPEGIRDLYQRLTKRCGDSHEAEHQLMECLGKMLWEAQREGKMPDETAYLKSIKGLLGEGAH